VYIIDGGSNEAVWAFNTRDLMRASSCDHCTKVAIARELAMPGVRELIEPYKQTGQTLAMAYGDRFEADIEAELRSSLGEASFKRPEGEDLFAETIHLMQAQTPVIYQGALRRRQGRSLFTGRPDFLVRADYDLEFVGGKLTAKQNADRIGQPGYIAWDAKLASTAKPHYLLQVALYVDALDALGLKAEGLHGLILGSRTIALFEEGEIVPAMRQARSELESAFELAASGDLSSFELKHLTLHCESPSSCKVCEYPGLCEHDRITTDHLVQVAGINKSQIEKLRKSGITTMAALAEATDTQRPEGFVPGSFDKLRKQAKLQTDFAKTGKHEYRLTDDPEIGVLPPPSPGDIFFDMEGFPYFEEKGGLEYLFGAITRESGFHAWWAHDRTQEANSFEGFIRFAIDRLEKDPDAHIYHYAPYEVSALTRLAARHGVMEAEVAWLVAENKMIDLYKVVKGSIMVSQPSYSIKKLEAFYEFQRKSTVVDAGSSIDEYEHYRQLAGHNPAEAERVLLTISDYNEDDCVSTLALYDWLSGMQGAHAKYAEHVRSLDRKKSERVADPDDEDGATNKAERELAELQRATDHMAKAIADWRWGESVEADYRATVWQALMHSVLYYKREEVIHWRERRIRRDSTDDNLHRDRKALVVEGCQQMSESLTGLSIDPQSKVTLSYRYQIQPGQTCFLKAGEAIFVRFNYGANQQDTDLGRITELSNDEVFFDRVTTVENSAFMPNAIFENFFIPARGKQDAVRNHALELANEWVSPRFEAPTGFAALDLLMRRKPRLLDSSHLEPVFSEDYLGAISVSTARLNSSVLAVQGPPGSGKTYVGSHTIAQLVANGKRVGVVANSHSAVENLLAGCISAGVSPEAISKQKKTGDSSARPWQTPSTYAVMANWRSKQVGGYVIGGTAWTFCSPKVLEQKLDYLFIDEAAQFSLVDAIAVAQCAKNMVLLGDPQQLTQVVQAVHPGGVDNSALGHYMGEQSILADEYGYFIDVTRRMHPKVNAPVSWLSYQGRLHSHEDAAKRSMANLAPGLTPVLVEHLGNSSHSPEEVEVVVDLVAGHSRELAAHEILVVAPYNAQVDSIREALDSAGFTEVQVGTVDKFQGREAMVVIISLAASSAEDAPRGLEFLLDRNRLNVALSRAKTNSYLVYSPALTRTRFTSVEDVKCVSRLVGLLEFA
jgi:predicted RecB family nuclease